jgi:hypothetical protein
MRVLALILVILLAFSGCATFNRSQSIDSDQLEGYASGQFRESSSGRTGTVAVVGSAAGGGAGNPVGFGLLGIYGTTGPPTSGSLEFARAISMLNYSKRLKSVKYDESGGIVEYEFDRGPLAGRTVSPPPSTRPKLPSSFGHQPVE